MNSNNIVTCSNCKKSFPAINYESDIYKCGDCIRNYNILYRKNRELQAKQNNEILDDRYKLIFDLLMSQNQKLDEIIFNLSSKLNRLDMMEVRIKKLEYMLQKIEYLLEKKS